jgi:hypothetical protein
MTEFACQRASLSLHRAGQASQTPTLFTGPFLLPYSKTT